MNRTLKTLAAAVVLLVLATAGCTDLTVPPKSDIVAEDAFRDPSAYQSFLAKLYSGLATSGQQGAAGNPDLGGIDEGFSQYLRLYWELQELPTDEAVIGWGDVGLPELNTGLWAVSNTFVGTMYYRIFYQVVLANEFLRQTTDAALDGRGNVSTSLRAEIQGFRAEARFLRALSYWHGLDLFGNIPILTENDPLGTLPAQRTRAEVFAFVVGEVRAIRAALPAPSGAVYGRATTAAADMLLAKLYLNAEVYTGVARYDSAMTAIQAVIAAPLSLDDNYREMFLADNNNSPEIIFAITQDGLRTQTWGGMTFLVHAACGGGMNPGDYGIDGCWWGLRLKPEAYNRYDQTNDLRAAFFYDTTGQTVAVARIDNFGDGIPAPKFINKTSTGANGSHSTHPDTDFPLFRLSDAYLMYAEANLRGGGGSAAQALIYVNLIRQRAYGGATGDITAGELTLDFILDERGRELLWEGHRRNDLVRYGRFTGNSYIWSWKGGTQAGTSLAAHLGLYPIPANELVGNPNLTQNPGY